MLQSAKVRVPYEYTERDMKTCTTIVLRRKFRLPCSCHKIKLPYAEDEAAEAARLLVASIRPVAVVD